jgi:FdrA protein
MSGVIVNEVRKSFYLDSVALMRFSRTIAGLDGIEEAALMMATPANRRIMTDAGLFDKAGTVAGGGDLVIGIRAKDRESADRALAKSRALLDRPTLGGAKNDAWRPRTLRAAVKLAPGSNLALISVPGDFAVGEARKAIRGGLHVMIFSDNVALAEEADLKQEARKLGRLVMGPDCGTAIINGAPLAFANKVPRGNIGIVGASGTGIQEISSLIGRYGGGVSHAIGVGGRDMKMEIGGISTLMALGVLQSDPGTDHIVLVSKPPPAAVAALVLERIGAIDKPATVCFIGAGELPMPANALQVFSLKDAALTALAACGIRGISDCIAGEAAAEDAWPLPCGRRQIRGLFSGGTLCAEAQVILRAAGEAVTSNAPVPGVAPPGGAGHTLLDLGDDAYTRGKPHPMIDPTVRDAAVIEALGDIDVGVVLADVVIGYGAHRDPAGHLAGVLAAHRPDTIVIASVTGTEGDPQVRSAQTAKLKAAGVHVAPTNADAAAWALSAIRSNG